MNSRIRAANRACRIFSQLQLAKPQLQGVEQNQSAQQGGPCPDYPFDRFERLNAADDTGEHPEDSSFGTARNQARRRWLRVQTAIAGPLLGVEQRRLPLEAEYAAIHIGLVEQH